MQSPMALALLVLVATIPVTAPAAAAVSIDGKLDAAYGAALSTQTTQTNGQVGGDDTQGLVDYGTGSELDQSYGFISGGVLYLFLAGNLYSWVQGIGPFAAFDHLEVFIDSRPGGQNQLRNNNPIVDGSSNTLNNLAGLTFDSGFAPDFWFGYHGGNIPGSPYSSTASYAELLTAGGGAGYDLGHGTAGGPGTLSGGTNPNGVLVTIDNSNVAGVTAGCGAASGTGVTTGIEWAIPLAAIGNPTGCVNVCVFVDYQYSTISTVSNQVLGPLPPGTCALGTPGTVSFSSFPGRHSFDVCPSGATPAHQASWGTVKVIYR